MDTSVSLQFIFCVHTIDDLQPLHKMTQQWCQKESSQEHMSAEIWALIQYKGAILPV